LRPAGLSWDMAAIFNKSDLPVTVADTTEAILDTILQQLDDETHVLIMSNGGFDNLHARLLERLHQTNLQE